MIYHRDLGFPARFVAPTHKARLIFTKHARQQSTLRNIVTPNVLNLAYVVVIEVGYGDNGRVNHYLVRTVYNGTHDITYALAPKAGGYLVKTLWLNAIDDNHSTLDRKRYATP